MRLLILLAAVWSTAFTLHAATPEDTLVVAVPLDGIISFDPAESFETVSNSVQRNLYQTLTEPDRNAPQQLAPLLASEWQPGSTPHSLRFTLRPDARFASGNAVTAAGCGVLSDAGGTAQQSAGVYSGRVWLDRCQHRQPVSGAERHTAGDALAGRNRTGSGAAPAHRAGGVDC